MKRQVLSTVLVAVMVSGLITVGTASANRGYRNGGCAQYGQGQGGMMFQELDQETQDKITQFRDDTQVLRKEIVMKRAEKRALFSSTNPEPAAAAKIAGELFDLRAAMRLKAQTAGVDQYIGFGGMRPGADCKKGRRGHGAGFRGMGYGGCQGGNRF